MARPQKSNLDYFSHDNGMRNDPKIKAIRARFGLKGYAIYNMLLETLSEADLLFLELDEIQMEIISGDFGIESGELTELIQYFEKIKLLKRQNGFLFCPQLDKRAERVFEKRKELLNSLRFEKGVNLTEIGVSNPKSTQSKVKKSKVKEIYIVPLNFWNSKEGLSTHELKGQIGERIKQQIDKHTKAGELIEDIKKATENYHKILTTKDPETGEKIYYFNYVWDFDEFLQRRGGYLNFKKDFEILHNNYLKREFKKQEPESGIDVESWKGVRGK